jgi:hypothetical protein
MGAPSPVDHGQTSPILARKGTFAHDQPRKASTDRHNTAAEVE